MKIDKEKLIKAIKEKYDVDYVTPYQHIRGGRMRFKISFELVEDTDKQERDFGVPKEQVKRFHEKR